MRIQNKRIAFCWKQQRENGWRGAWEDVWRVLPSYLSPKLHGLSKFPVRLLIRCIQTVIIFILGSQHHAICLSFTRDASAKDRRCQTYNGMRYCPTTHIFWTVYVTHGTKNRHNAVTPSQESEVSTGHIQHSITAPSAETKHVCSETDHYIAAPCVLNSAVQPTDTVREPPLRLSSHHQVTPAGQRKNGFKSNCASSLFLSAQLLCVLSTR
jgi:uncharacterized membrane protein YhdT